MHGNRPERPGGSVSPIKALQRPDCPAQETTGRRAVTRSDSFVRQTGQDRRRLTVKQCGFGVGRVAVQISAMNTPENDGQTEEQNAR